jgi:hypothetical protein
MTPVGRAAENLAIAFRISPALVERDLVIQFETARHRSNPCNAQNVDQVRPDTQPAILPPGMRLVLSVGAAASLVPAIATRGSSVVSLMPISWAILPSAIYCTPPGGDHPNPARRAQRADPR